MTRSDPTPPCLAEATIIGCPAPAPLDLRHTRGIVLEPTPTGGWVVWRRPAQPGGAADVLGAYTHSADLMTALVSALPAVFDAA